MPLCRIYASLKWGVIGIKPVIELKEKYWQMGPFEKLPESVK